MDDCNIHRKKRHAEIEREFQYQVKVSIEDQKPAETDQLSATNDQYDISQSSVKTLIFKIDITILLFGIISMY